MPLGEWNSRFTLSSYIIYFLNADKIFIEFSKN